MYPLQYVIIAVFRSFPALVGRRRKPGFTGARGKAPQKFAPDYFFSFWISVITYWRYRGNLIPKLGFDFIFPPSNPLNVRKDLTAWPGKVKFGLNPPSVWGSMRKGPGVWDCSFAGGHPVGTGVAAWQKRFPPVSALLEGSWLPPGDSLCAGEPDPPTSLGWASSRFDPTRARIWQQPQTIEAAGCCDLGEDRGGGSVPAVPGCVLTWC